MYTKPEPTLGQNQIEALSSQLGAQTCPFVYVNQVSKSRLECKYLQVTYGLAEKRSAHFCQLNQSNE